MMDRAGLRERIEQIRGAGGKSFDNGLFRVIREHVDPELREKHGPGDRGAAGVAARGAVRGRAHGRAVKSEAHAGERARWREMRAAAAAMASMARRACFLNVFFGTSDGDGHRGRGRAMAA
ncbi:hypothetical protein [Nannocystis exedens]|uniref:hypothetical protein n=1 Tax=Nannocystis exedens TaxID=54 RepID=UPI000BBA063F|nr:hypothetical protein [Nannocystis exedens]PCC75852.1 hypothetical protein NAEX_08965 [Nannocystis exedens]